MEVGDRPLGSNNYQQNQMQQGQQNYNQQQNFNNQQNYIPQNSNRNNTPTNNSNGLFIGVIIALGVLVIILFMSFSSVRDKAEKLSADNKSLKEENQQLKDDNKALEDDNKDLYDKISKLDKRVNSQDYSNETQQESVSTQNNDISYNGSEYFTIQEIKDIIENQEVVKTDANTIVSLYKDNNNKVKLDTYYSRVNVAITGKIKKIESYDDYNVVFLDNDELQSWIGIQCYFERDTLKEEIANLNIGEYTTIYGVGYNSGKMYRVYSCYKIEETEQPVKQVEDNQSKTTSNNSTPQNITYNSYSYATLLDELNDNPLRAETNHQDEYVSITGYLDNIDSDGKYFSIGDPDGNYEHFLMSIQCDITNDTVKQKIMNHSLNDKITVKGKITMIGEVMGYYIDAYEVN